MRLSSTTTLLMTVALLATAPMLRVDTAEAQSQQSQATRGGSLGQDHDWFGSRLKIRGHHLFTNYDTVRGDESGLGGKVGYGGGVEIVLPSGLGIGVVGYTNGRVSEWDREFNTVNLAAEVNYFLKLRRLRLAPFAGVHGGVVRFSEGGFEDFGWHDGFSDLGYQYGVRFQPFTLVGVDVQMRHLSAFMSGDPMGGGTDRHFLIGLTLF